MFTGIVTDVGRIVRPERLDAGRRFRVASQYDPAGIALGASIACSGVCLTVTALPQAGDADRWFEVEAWEEGSALNLERSLKIGDEIGGHLVSGHVDGQAEIVAVTGEGEAVRFTLQAPGELSRFIARKGSVCLDGTSLTVNGVDGDRFDVLLIRHSLDVTTWGTRKAGDRVNLEVDQIARYAERLFGARSAGS